MMKDNYDKISDTGSSIVMKCAVESKPLNRQSNFELLRIVAMLMIIAHHFSMHGDFTFDIKNVSINLLWVDFFSMGGKIGVNLYVIISGYFLINTTRLKMDKILRLWSKLLLFSVLLSILVFSFKLSEGVNQYNTNGFIFEMLLPSFFPVITRVWWFASTYFVLYCFSPLINRFLKSLDKKTYKVMLLGMTFMWSVVPSFTIYHRTVDSNQLWWFVYLYCLVGYYRIHGLSPKIADKKARNWIWWAIVGVLITFLSVVVLRFLGARIHFFEGKSRQFLHEQSILLLLISVFLFLGFEKFSFRSKAINLIASSTFGIYLIHDYGYIRAFLWNTVFQVQSFQNSRFLIPYSIAVVFIVFVACCAIDLACHYTVQKAVYKGVFFLFRPLINKAKEIVSVGESFS